MPHPADDTPDIACFRCGECCRRYQVLLDRAEAERLAHHLRVPLNEFLAKFADPRWPGVNSYLLRHNEGGCPFLRQRGDEFLCAIHRIKPRSCRDWTADLCRRECQRGLAGRWRLTVDNDGELAGAPEDIRAFWDFQERYRED